MLQCLMFFAIVTMLGNGENVTVATAKMEKQERVSAREIESPKDGLFAKKMETTTFLFVWGFFSILISITLTLPSDTGIM